MIHKIGNYVVNSDWIAALDSKMDEQSLAGFELATETAPKFKKYQLAGYDSCHIRFRVSNIDNAIDGPWHNPQYLLIRQSPGHMLPVHVDELEPYREKYNIDSVWQNLIFLNDWQCGQVFGVEDDTITNWKAGDAICWKWMTEHYLVNASLIQLDLLQILSSNDPTQEKLQLD